MEEGAEDSDALRLLQGFETSGAVRSFHPSSPKQVALLLTCMAVLVRSVLDQIIKVALNLHHMITGGMFLLSLPP